MELAAEVNRPVQAIDRQKLVGVRVPCVCSPTLTPTKMITVLEAKAARTDDDNRTLMILRHNLTQYDAYNPAQRLVVPAPPQGHVASVASHPLLSALATDAAASPLTPQQLDQLKVQS